MECRDKYEYRYRAGQKTTIGSGLSQFDMPFSSNGQIPDIVINPNCIPKRMTIAQLIEICHDKATQNLQTPFQKVSLVDITRQLEMLGFENYQDTID